MSCPSKVFPCFPFNPRNYLEVFFKKCVFAQLPLGLVFPNKTPDPRLWKNRKHTHEPLLHFLIYVNTYVRRAYLLYHLYYRLIHRTEKREYFIDLLTARSDILYWNLKVFKRKRNGFFGKKFKFTWFTPITPIGPIRRIGEFRSKVRPKWAQW